MAGDARGVARDLGTTEGSELLLGVRVQGAGERAVAVAVAVAVAGAGAGEGEGEGALELVGSLWSA